MADRLDLDIVISSGRHNRSESLFEMLFERNPIPLLIFNASRLDFVAVNLAACSLYRYDRNELLGMSVLDLRAEEEREEAKAAVMSFGEVHRPQDYRTQVTAGGRLLRVLTYAQRIYYNGEDCVAEWNIDVTEREQSSVELRRTQIFLNAVVESIPSMVFVKDAQDGRFVLLNKAGEDLLGVDRRDLIGKTDFDLFAPNDAKRFRLADQAVVASGKLVTIENEPLTTPEGIKSLRTQKIGVPDINGDPRYLLGISEDVTEKLRTEELNRHLALHDVLTDLPNRLQFLNILELEIENGGGSAFALLLIDLDRFKAVNDRLGHHAGDELLRQVSARMLALLRAGDIVARLGGDEFGVICRTSACEQGVSEVARVIITALCEPFYIEGQSVSVSCSLGLVLSTIHGRSADALMKRADLALYAAKATGRGDYAWFEFEMEEHADRQRLLRDELSVALSRNQLYLEYQPIVNMASGEIVCCEALLRWRHPTRGLISPTEFIPVAESSNLIEAIGRWVLEQACSDASTWPADVRVAVNLSPRQFQGFNLAADIVHILERTKLSPKRLELEITESVFLNESGENVCILNQLKELGIQVALDDFGTGYSSLAYLRRFKFDKLKIDRSFITDLATSPESLAIVRAVIGLGRSFNATVTAEGVETARQYRDLAQEGCDQSQGYLISRPVTAETVLNLLNRSRHMAAEARFLR